MGGRGGRSGGRGGMGGGGGAARGGRAGGESRERPIPPLRDAALFTAQSAVFGKYLERAGYEVIGELLTAQMGGASLDDVFARHEMGAIAQVDADWRRWVAARAATLSHR